MKFLGVSGVFDYAGPNRSPRYRACSCCLPRISRASASGLTVFGAEYPPRLSSVYASLCTSRYPAQDSRPSGSLLLSRKELSSSASCRFSPAHCNGLFATVIGSTEKKIGNRTSRSRPDEEGQVDFLKCQPAYLAGSNTVDAVRLSLHMTPLVVIDNDNNCL